MPTNALALSRLLLTERSALLRQIRRLVGSERAEDVVQRLWLKIQAVRDDPPIENPEAYLHRLAINAATDELRASARESVNIRAEIHMLLWVEDDSPSPDRVAIGRDMLARIREAMDSLPEPTGDIFRLNRLQGLSQREIATRYGISTTVVERHIRRALKALARVQQAS